MKTVAVIFGSRSTEHDVSIVTAISSIIKPLELSGQFQVEPVYIAKDGSWYWDQRLKDISLYQGEDLEDFLHKAPKVHLLFDHGLTLVKSSQFAGRKAYRKIDVVFPATHGTHGEDGELMGILEMAGVPYVGCGVAASAIAMDKVLAKLIVEADGIPTPKMQFINTTDLERQTEAFTKAVNDKLKYPLFVKPAHLGSSIGITKVDSPKELDNALEVAAHYDTKVLAEEGVPNLIEVTVPIIGNDSPQAAMVERPLSKEDGVFDFESKYMNQGKGGKKMGGKQGAQGYSQVPADLPEDLYKQAEKTALRVYKAIGCEGIARVDLLIDNKSKTVYFNEVNPLPGSLYAHNWRAAGVSNVELVTRLIRLAEDRFAAQARTAKTFQTNFLKQF
jgi:D-alanine-D-alanine ligase